MTLTGPYFNGQGRYHGVQQIYSRNIHDHVPRRTGLPCIWCVHIASFSAVHEFILCEIFEL